MLILCLDAVAGAARRARRDILVSDRRCLHQLPLRSQSGGRARLGIQPGRVVEGYSNFLWVLELAALWAAFGLRPEHAAPWLSATFTAARPCWRCR